MKTIRRQSLRMRTAAALLLSALAGAACSSPGSNTVAPAAPQDTAARIAAEIGDAACDNSQQCRTLAYGHKACGGPERYLPWSSKRSDAVRLARLGQQLADERRRQDEREGMMSTCSVVLDPGAVCEAGRCVLRQQNPGGAPPAR